ncbi:hypothetical protein VA596_25455 [Amycolatopsis sp., V23-08]|uniref:Uncharacterized protein n=1 Tax=Amycolatopsis heterodermiae TaxID=3110235 RepID=A0ABU5RBB9_9PSEU|nr:hypothetical protein [Amycolatopsis sp., V23-08]MEA5362905.1 hypothetical protein [Amycolatopsis sp., V23-08]
MNDDWLSTDYGQARAAKAEQTRDALTQSDLRIAEGWEKARSIITTSDGVIYFDALADLAIGARQADLGHVPAAFLTNPHFTPYNYATSIDRLGDVEVMPQATRAQIRNLAREVATRFCRELTLNSYTVLDLPQLAGLAQVNDDLTGTALCQLGSHPTALEATECFWLAATLPVACRPTGHRSRWTTSPSCLCTSHRSTAHPEAAGPPAARCSHGLRGNRRP